MSMKLQSNLFSQTALVSENNVVFTSGLSIQLIMVKNALSGVLKVGLLIQGSLGQVRLCLHVH